MSRDPSLEPAAAGALNGRPWAGRLGRVGMTPVIGAYVALLLLVIVSTIASSDFLTSSNLSNVLRQAAPLALVAFGQTVVILAGGIDVSVGAVISLTTVVSAKVMNADAGMVLPTILLVLAIALAIGFANGFLIGYLRADAFVTTLATMLIVSGGVLVYTQGSPSTNLTPGFREISEGTTLGLPNGVFFVIVAFAILGFALRHTVWGRRVYALGSNPRVARLTGQPQARTTLRCYMLCSLLAGVAGLLLVARLGSGDVNAGDGWELDAIAAVLIGGTVFGGGKGGITGTVAGVLVLTCLFNLVSLLALPDWVQLIVRGVVIVAGVALYARRVSATA
jgi:ribose/xylose/arabinose/galactoside ABC-type transport system permease subunit